VSTSDIVVLINRDDDAHSSIRKQVRFKLLTWRAMTKATWAKLPVLSLTGFDVTFGGQFIATLI